MHDPAPVRAVPAGPAAVASLSERPYTPWATLAPRFWVPYIEADGDNTVVGAATGARDGE